jgi:hypothetical protein
MRIVENDGGMENSSIRDTNYCTIRSIAIAFKIPFEEAYLIGKEAGRKHGQGFYLCILMNFLKRNTRYNNFKRVKLNPNGITIRRFLENNPIGKFICGRRGHAFSIIHGEIQDLADNTERQIIKEAYEVN